MNWKPISSAPKDGTVIIVTDGDGLEITYWSHDHWSCTRDPDGSIGGYGGGPTHWADPYPLPK
jgi:hypothetical protein